jgi:hypothetical protein
MVSSWFVSSCYSSIRHTLHVSCSIKEERGSVSLLLCMHISLLSTVDCGADGHLLYVMTQRPLEMMKRACKRERRSRHSELSSPSTTLKRSCCSPSIYTNHNIVGTAIRVSIKSARASVARMKVNVESIASRVPAMIYVYAVNHETG